MLGYLPREGFAGGRMTLDVEAAREAIERDIAKPLGIDVVEAAWGIERIVTANMANATRRVLSSHGADARELSLIAYGGNGGVHGWSIAADLGAKRFLVPRTAPAFSALGLLVANYRVDLVKAYVAPIAQVDVARVRALMQETLDEVQKDLVAPAGLRADEVELELFVQMAYPGQNFDLSVPCPEGTRLDAASLPGLEQRFHDVHKATRGFAFRENAPILRGVRLIGQGITRKPERAAEPGTVRDPNQARKGDATRVLRRRLRGNADLRRSAARGRGGDRGAGVDRGALHGRRPRSRLSGPSRRSWKLRREVRLSKAVLLALIRHSRSERRESAGGGLRRMARRCSFRERVPAVMPVASRRAAPCGAAPLDFASAHPPPTPKYHNVGSGLAALEPHTSM